MIHVTAALSFILLYVLWAVACGAAATRFLRHPDEETAPRDTLATFVIGGAIAPFFLGAALIAFWHVAPGLSRFAALAVLFSIPIVAIVALRHVVIAAFRPWIGRILPPRGVPGLMLIGALVAIGPITVLTALTSLHPTEHWDATVYALEARRLADARSMDAVLPRTPDERHRVSNNNHGKSYQALLAAALLFEADAAEDYPVRVAPRLLIVHLVLVLMALALRAGPAAALVAPILLGFSHSFDYTYHASSRDAYYLLAVLFVLGAVGRAFRPAAPRTAIWLFLGFAFLANSHVIALMLGGVLAIALAMVSPDWRSRFALPLIVAAGFTVGGSHIIRTAVSQGDPAGQSFINEKIYTPDILDAYWASRDRDGGALESGWSSLIPRLRVQLRSDGPILATLTWFTLLAFPALLWRARRGPPERRWPPLIITAWLAALGVQLALLGAADLVDDRVGVLLAANLRYRIAMYLLVILVVTSIVQRAVDQWSPSLVVRAVAYVVLVALAANSARLGWSRPDLQAAGLSRAASFEAFSSRPYRAWVKAFAAVPPDELIISDRPYEAWYHLDENLAMAYHDPRMVAVYAAETPAAAIAELDALGAAHVCISPARVRLLESTGFGAALLNPLYFRRTFDHSYLMLYTRTSADDPPPHERPDES